MAATHRPTRLRSILCAVDFSVHSRHALRYAASVARRFRGQITTLFVNEPLLFAAGRRMYGGGREFLDESREELSRFASEAVGRPANRMAALVTVGDPADEILRTARRLRTDVVVIGAQGLSGVRRLFFGSTTDQVLRRATVPVLAIPPLKHRRSASAGLVVDRVIVPIDLAGEWHSDVIRGAAIARRFRVPLELLHVLRPVQAPAWIPFARSLVETERVDTARQSLERAMRVLGHPRRSTCAVVVGDPAHEIARRTKQGSPLVVMSLRGTGGIVGRRGAIAYHVLTHALTPVLALPRRQFSGRLSTRLRRAVTDVLTARDRLEMAGMDAVLSIASGRTRGNR